MPGSDRSHLVRPDQLRRALRLASELRDLTPGSDEQRHHALEGLCALVDAHVGLWVTVEAVPAGHVVIRTARDHGWSNDRERDMFRHFARSEEVQRRDPSVAAMLRRMNEKDRVTSLLRDDLIDSRAWYRSDHVQEYRRGCGVDSFISTVARTSATTASCPSLHRPWGDKPFSERDRLIIDIFHREHEWLHTPYPAVCHGLLAGIAPRLRQTLASLARGSSEKQIAEELAISPHTVHDYVKALHRHFGVSSRGELLALYLGSGAPATAASATAPGPSAREGHPR
jgi:DNA-binding CsgD family transcriptional regulator